MTFPVPGRRQVSWLAALHPSPSRFPSGRASRRLTDFSAYSDEIAQALHLFPFYPLPLSAAKAPTAFVILLYILYPRPVPAVKTKRPEPGLLPLTHAEYPCDRQQSMRRLGKGFEPTTLNGCKAWSKGVLCFLSPCFARTVLRFFCHWQRSAPSQLTACGC